MPKQVTGQSVMADIDELEKHSTGVFQLFEDTLKRLATQLLILKDGMNPSENDPDVLNAAMDYIKHLGAAALLLHTALVGYAEKEKQALASGHRFVDLFVNREQNAPKQRLDS